MTSDAARGAAVQPERLKPLHLVALGGEPSEGRPRDDVIEREEPAHEDDRGRGLRPAVSHVGDAKRLIDGLAGEQHGARAAGEDGPRVLDGELLLDESADEPQQAFTVVGGLEVHPTLRARKRAAMADRTRRRWAHAVCFNVCSTRPGRVPPVGSGLPAMRQPASLPSCHRPGRTGPGPLAARPGREGYPGPFWADGGDTLPHRLG